jgi:hypothetical protein
MEALKRLYEAVLRGGMRGWNPDDPIGYDPQTKAGHRQLVQQYPILAPVQAFNEMIGYPAMAAGDAVLRGGNALLHGGAAFAGQATEEIGLSSPGMGKRLERDLLGMAQMSIGGAGRLGGVAAQSRNAASRAHEIATARRFVKNADGNPDLGRIGPEVETTSGGRFPQAPIRMQQGISGKEGYGARHISPDKHQRAQDIGYRDGLDLIKDVAKSHDTVVEQINGRLMLVKTDGQNRYAIAEFQDGGWKRLIGKDDPYYGVTTGYPDRGNAIGKPHRTDLIREIKKGGKLLGE